MQPGGGTDCGDAVDGDDSDANALGFQRNLRVGTLRHKNFDAL